MTELRPTPQDTSLATLCHELGLPVQTGLVRGLTLDSRLVQAGDLYAALPGANTHGAHFIDDAIRAGAAAILTDPAGAQALREVSVPLLVVADPRAALGRLAAQVYRGPRPRLVGVTGTNGKTTTTHAIQSAAEAAGWPTAVFGTLGVHFHDLHSYSGRTTPEAPAVHAALTSLGEAGARLAAMEVSSHALALHRVDAVTFDVAVFLGLTQDHLDFHGTMEAYFEAKALLFAQERAACAVVNSGDEWGRRLLEGLRIPVTTYAQGGAADWTAQQVRVTADGRTHFEARGPRFHGDIELPLPGAFNVDNALAALAALDSLDVDVEAAARGLSSLRVPGRFERVENHHGITAYVDYAHTPDAVDKVLRVARAATAGRLIAVLGCGGDRDAAKRPHMGAAAAALADTVIITDDNPRSEDPSAIRAAVRAGAAAGADVREIGDRTEAIRQAVHLAQAGDCLMVLGKGHETGQEIAGIIQPFDDRAVLRQALEDVA